tara:strand:- start:473 stop:1138 length:666 start_codon:yes stop_codon:yes gene_type:complete
MYTQNKKKFYIIGSNHLDFMDTTVEGVSTLLKCDLIIIPKSFKKEFREFFINNGKKTIEFNTFNFDNDLFFKKVFDLFRSRKKIGLLINGDPHFHFTNNINIFFSKKKIDVVKILGILEIAQWVNKKCDFLTNREKNSSLFFFIPSSNNEIRNILGKCFSGKLIIQIKNKALMKECLILLKKKILKNKFKLYINGSRKYLVKNITNFKINYVNAYFVVECE